MSARRHPSEERLLAFEAGTLSAPEAVVAATHLAMRPQTRAWTHLAQAVGGAVLDDLAPSALEDGALAAVLARLDSPDPEAGVAPPPPTADHSLPSPLRSFELGPWRWADPSAPSAARDLRHALPVRGGP